MNRLIGAAAVVAAFFLSAAAPGVALGQMLCGQHDAIVEELRSGYGEELTAWALTTDDNLLELYVAESGTFTVLITYPNGMICLLEAGTDWTITPRGIQA